MIIGVLRRQGLIVPTLQRGNVRVDAPLSRSESERRALLALRSR